MCCSLIKDWEYRAEGNKSIVIANVEKQIVYRILKTTAVATEVNEQEKICAAVQRTVDFQANVMRPRIGLEYLTQMHIVKLSPEFLDAVRDLVSPHRPVSRLSAGLNAGTSLAIQMTDLCQIPINSHHPAISLEIKPKWGFMPSNAYVADVKFSNCRFCMHQHIKISSGRKWRKKSHYCPIDLFSGCPIRIKSALERLFETPQNNLRLFVNGTVVWSEEVCARRDMLCEWERLSLPPDVLNDLYSLPDTLNSSADKNRMAFKNLVAIVTQCVLHDSSVKDMASQPTIPCSPVTQDRQSCRAGHNASFHICTPDCPLVPEGCVLSRILNTQHLDDLDIEGLFPFYEKLVHHFNNFPQAREEAAMNGPYHSDWLPVGQPSPDSSNSPVSSCDWPLYKVKEFLTSRSAKDCSIMITIKRIDDNTRSSLPAEEDYDSSNIFYIDDIYGAQFACRVSVIDLDPKSFDKIPFYMEEDREVINNFIKNKTENGGRIEEK